MQLSSRPNSMTAHCFQYAFQSATQATCNTLISYLQISMKQSEYSIVLDFDSINTFPQESQLAI